MSQSPEENVRKLVKSVAERLLRENIHLVTAESCTGGWIAQVLTSLPGSSGWFDGGFVTYSNKSKERMLNLPPSLFVEGGPGAVSRETVLAMASGALANSDANIAIASTGISGPDGGTEEKPVGTVWLAWERRDGHKQAKEFLFDGDRYGIRVATVEQALKGLVSFLDGTVPPHKPAAKEK